MKKLFVWMALAAAAGCSSTGGGSPGSGGSGGAGGAGGNGGACTDSPNACHDTCDPCTKLTAAQVSTATGVTVVQGKSYDGHACEWEQDDTSGLPVFQVQFTANIRATETGCDEVSNPDAGIIVTPVSGVGDLACYAQIVGLGTPLLTFSKGCWAYSIAVSGDGVSDATAEADEQALALVVLPSL
ncbi:MAG TPA: hypothetical protein VKZ18_04295 [Polyangia bacterium]|nr:hypothetical protein [Polyangia bacterium]